MKTHFLDKVSPYWLLVLTTLFWGGNANLARAFAEIVPPLGLSYWRWALAWLILLPFVWRPMRDSWPLVRQHWLLVLSASILGVFAFNTLLYFGLQTTSVINAVIIQSIVPILIFSLSAIWLKEHASRIQWLGVMLSLLGVFIILVRGDWRVLTHFDVVIGDGFVLAAVCCWACYTVLLRKLPPALKGAPFLGFSITIGSWLLLPVYLYSDQSMPFNTEGVVSVLYTAIFASLLAYLFWNHATEKLGANRTGQFIHLVPVFGVLIAILVLGETLHAFHWFGGLLVAMGLLLSNQSKLILSRTGASTL